MEAIEEVSFVRALLAKEQARIQLALEYCQLIEKDRHVTTKEKQIVEMVKNYLLED